MQGSKCAQSQGVKYYELQATTEVARRLISRRRSPEGNLLLAEVYGWFTEGFDTPAIKEAKVYSMK